jgi:hypothetical protein
LHGQNDTTNFMTIPVRSLSIPEWVLSVTTTL